MNLCDLAGLCTVSSQTEREKMVTRTYVTNSYYSLSEEMNSYHGVMCIISECERSYWVSKTSRTESQMRSVATYSFLNFPMFQIAGECMFVQALLV